jgi:hypothetical protein
MNAQEARLLAKGFEIGGHKGRLRNGVHSLPQFPARRTGPQARPEVSRIRGTPEFYRSARSRAKPNLGRSGKPVRRTPAAGGRAAGRQFEHPARAGKRQVAGSGPWWKTGARASHRKPCHLAGPGVGCRHLGGWRRAFLQDWIMRASDAGAGEMRRDRGSRDVSFCAEMGGEGEACVDPCAAAFLS